MGYLERFIEWDTVAPSSKRLRGHYLKRFLADHDPLSAGPEEISLWVHRGGWAKNTQATAFSSLKRFFFWLHEIVEERPDNPMRKVSKPKAKIGEPRPVPEDVIRRILADVQDPDMALMLRLGALQGLRRAEIAGLRLGDVDFDAGVIYVRGKGSKVRRIPLHPEVRPWLERRSGDFVFPSLKTPGAAVTPTTVGRKVRAALGKQFSTHQLRHRFASAVYQSSGHDLRLVQELLGHASVATTQIYTAVSSDSMRDAVAGV
jgi:integrase/recombinase XerD